MLRSSGSRERHLQADPEAPSDDASRASITPVEIVLIATLVVVWIPGILQLAAVWSSVEYASHGFLVPLVALWAATAHRAELASLAPRPLVFGRVLLAGLAALYLGALTMRNPTALGLLAVATVASAVLALRGIAWARTLQFPLGYLLFMIPLPSAWVTPLIVQLQLLVSNVAVFLLREAGVAIYREGNVLILPGDVSLFVAEACSGITSLITLLPIGVFIAYFTESILWRRLFLIVSVIPIALAGNLLRVILTVQLATDVSVEFATEGPLHEWAGVATYLVGCLVLLAIGALLRRVVPTAEPDSLG
jgi:exosortase